MVSVGSPRASSWSGLAARGTSGRKVRLGYFPLALLLYVGHRFSFQAGLSYNYPLQDLETAPYLPSSGLG